jgi:hypothetical protein
MLGVRLSNLIVAASAVCFVAAPAAAQTAAPPNPAPSPQAESPTPPDVSITANVTAGELLFRKVPNPRVEFTGRPERRTVWEADRHNLPQEVQPGVTYRDIGITLRIQSIFPDIERIVAEALGEVPPADASPPAAEPAPPAASTPSPATSQPTRRRPRRGRGQ